MALDFHGLHPVMRFHVDVSAVKLAFLCNLFIRACAWKIQNYVEIPAVGVNAYLSEIATVSLQSLLEPFTTRAFLNLAKRLSDHVLLLLLLL